ncbi:MAG: hypothetical protein KDG89_09500, partial [Geminicoccaceae bacterium]|nr:hypothetical protein [Geminicoccaceae bacterium]
MSAPHDTSEPKANDPFVVTTAADVVDAGDGVLSLREAVDAADANAGTDTITFADGLSGATIRLDRGVPIMDDLVIDGDAADGGPGGVTIDFAESLRDSDISKDTFRAYAGADLRIEDLTVLGSGVRGYAALDLARVRVEATEGYYSGNAVQIEGGTLNVTDSTIIGGAYDGISGGGTVTVTRSEVGTRASYDGSAIGVAGKVTVVDSLINGVSGDVYASGIRVFATDDAELVMVNSTITGVRAGSYGGNAVTLDDGVQATITNSTLAGNDFDFSDIPPDRDFTAAVFGLGEGAELRLENSLVLANAAPDGEAALAAGGGTLASNGG